MNHHAAAGGRFPCLTEKRHAIKLTTLTTSTWWPSRMENPSKKVTLCYIYIFNFAQRVGSKHLQSNPLPHLVVLHQPYAGGYTSGGCLEQPNMLGNNKHYIFPFGILKGQMILYCHSTGGTTLEDVNECDCHAAEFHPTLFWHPRTKQLKLHFLDTYSTASTKPSFLSWQQTVTQSVWVSSQRILSCPHTPHLMPKFSSSTSAASSA